MYLNCDYFLLHLLALTVYKNITNRFTINCSGTVIETDVTATVVLVVVASISALVVLIE